MLLCELRNALRSCGLVSWVRLLMVGCSFVCIYVGVRDRDFVFYLSSSQSQIYFRLASDVNDVLCAL